MWKPKFLRQDYMSGKCTHREYYGQFVTDSLKSQVASVMGLEYIQKSTDKYFNDKPCSRPTMSSGILGEYWDDAAALASPFLDHKIRMADGGVSLADRVCAVKEAANQLREEYLVEQNNTNKERTHSDSLPNNRYSLY